MLRPFIVEYDMNLPSTKANLCMCKDMLLALLLLHVGFLYQNGD